ncbi:MAG: riboflavin synthase [Micavibrio sp.]|nr:riboflavin synthase [Micavibrio sp.]|tara:strand:+ start:1406 stop:1996 length:591 start_codon:yes stop_codon:yes gene_type:complete
MFTGIIIDIGSVKEIDKQGDWRITIGVNDFDLSTTEIGASICCSGCCLTVIEKGADWFRVDVSAESLSKTIISSWGQGTLLNLEPALKMGDELGGHIVSGHVDGLAELTSIKVEQDSHRLSFKVPDDLALYIASKGSVTLDGVSLTVNEVQDNQFGVNIIPHTWENTTLGQLKEGSKVNIEIDMLARYVARMLGKA